MEKLIGGLIYKYIRKIIILTYCWPERGGFCEPIDPNKKMASAKCFFSSD